MSELPVLPLTGGEDAPVLCAEPGEGVVFSTTAAARLESRHHITLESSARDALHGVEEFTAMPPGVPDDELEHLDGQGRARVGTAVCEGLVLVGKKTPTRPQVQRPGPVEAELGQIFGDDDAYRDSSLRAPPHSTGQVVAVREHPPQKKGDPWRVEVDIAWTRVLQVGDLISVEHQPQRVTEIRDGLNADLTCAGPVGDVQVRKHECACDLLHGRSIGPYSLVTQQPMDGRARFGGQRVERADLQAVLDRGAPVTALEWQSMKSDSVQGRTRLYEGLVLGDATLERVRSGGPAPRLGSDTDPEPESTRVLEAELRAMGLAVDLTAAAPSVVPLDTAGVLELGPVPIRKPETINYRTYQPESEGLFCTTAFGELDDARSRRRTFAHIVLPVPLLPPLLKPAVARLLGVSVPDLDTVLHSTAALVATDDGWQAKLFEELGELSESGGAAVRRALKALDLASVAADARGQKRRAVAQQVLETGRDPASWLVDAWPVLPADLRPLVPLGGGRWATSDLNDHYRRVINRSNRLKRLLDLNAPPIILHNEVRHLQRAVDQLVDNSGPNPVTGPNKRPLRSLVDMARQRLAGEGVGSLLSKRVDYSGTAVAVPDPALSRDRCRIPRTLAVELLRPLIYQELEERGHVRRIKAAKNLVDRDPDGPVVSEALQAALATRPLLLLPDRAFASPNTPPMVWSCEAETIDDAAVRVAPEVFAALGDRVCVHVPATDEAVAEARTSLRQSASQVTPPEPSGWLGRALSPECRDPIAEVVTAALSTESDPLTDPWSRLALGRPPA